MTILDRTGSVVDGTAIKAPCAVATVGSNITLSGLFALDGVALLNNMRVLVKDQTDARQNGIYQAQTGNWIRPNDANNNLSFVQGTEVFVAQGSINAGLTFSVTTVDDPVVIGTSLINWAAETLFAGGGAGAAGELQFNRAGLLAGMSGTVWDPVNLTLTLSGSVVTAFNPVLNLSQTWNNNIVAFTGIVFDATDSASLASSLLLDLQVGGTSKFNVSKSGAITGLNFTSAAQGLAPASGGGTVKFLRADGTWAALSAGGSTGQVQYNNAGALAGMAGTSWDSTNLALTIAGATLTASHPLLNLSQTWNSSGATFTGLLLNVTATAFSSPSPLLDLQAGGTSLARVELATGGEGQLAQLVLPRSSANPTQTAILNFAGANFQIITNIATSQFEFNSNGTVEFLIQGNTGHFAAFSSTLPLGWTSSSANSGNFDTAIFRVGTAGVMGLANQASPISATALRVFNTTDTVGGAPTNYEAGTFDWTTLANVLTIGTLSGGTGTARNIQIKSAGSQITFAYSNRYAAMNSSNGAFTLAGGSGMYWGISSDATLGTSTIGTVDVGWWREGAGLFAIADPSSITTAAGLRVYNTTDAVAAAPTANYERGVFDWTTNANVLTVGTQKGGTGSTRNLEFVIGGANELDYGITNAGAWSSNVSLFVNGDLYTKDSSFLIRTKATLSNGAGGSTATFTNAPAATNPTKWIPIDDNGTTRYVPAF